MQRRVNRADTEALLDKAARRAFRIWCCGRRSSPASPARRTPSSRSCVEFVAEQRFERLGVFTYSFEPDTPAAKLPDHLPEEVKNERRDRLMAVQQEVAFEWNDAQIGRQLDVLIDAAVPDEKNAWIGRSYADAPDVDGVVYVTGEKLSAGSIVPCEIVARSDYDLVAAAVGDAALSRLTLPVPQDRNSVAEPLDSRFDRHIHG